MVRLVLPKRREILVFRAELKRGMCEEKRIWRFGLNHALAGSNKHCLFSLLLFFVKEKNVKETE